MSARPATRRRLLASAGAALALFVASSACADGAPMPTRPEWQETPMPMPEPLEIAATLGLVSAALGLALQRARRAAR